MQVATALALVALALPWLQDEIAPRAGVSAVPGYWTAAADYLAQQDRDGSVSLEVPAAAFGVYDWGNVHDDVLQGLATSPWAVRNVIPLAPPGNVVFLDAVTRVSSPGTRAARWRPTSPPTASDGSWSATTSTGSRPVRPTRRTSAACSPTRRA